MPLNPLIKTKAIIDNTWNKVWSAIKDHTFSVSVENQIEIPEVKFPEINIPEYPEQIDTRTELRDIVNIIIKQTQELKTSPDVSATKKQLLDTLDKIFAFLSKDKKDLTPDLIAEIQALRDDLGNIGSQIPKTDLKPIQSQIEALIGTLDFSGLKKFTRYDDLKVYINERQFEKLVKAMNVSVSAGGGSSVMRTTAGEVGASNPVPVSMSSDIQIGAVEIKDDDSNTRLSVESDGTKNAAYVQANNLDIRNLAQGSDSVSAHQGGNWDIRDITGTISLPTGAATSANQDSLVVELKLLNGAYAMRYDEDGGGAGVSYQGWAVPGTATSAASWRIRRIDTSSSPDVVIDWADGDDSFNNIWDNRAGLSYS